MRRPSLSWSLSILLGLVAIAAPAPAFAGARPAAFPWTIQTQPTAKVASPLPPAPQPISGTVQVTAVDAQAFPAVNVYLAVNDPAGQHIAGLPASAFHLTEDSAPVASTGLSVAEKDVGIETVFALDTSPAFKTRDLNAVTRLDYIKQALSAFGTQTAPRLKDGVDDASLLTPEGVLLAHTSQGQALADALGQYTTSFAGAADPLPLINQALDYASETMPRPGMPRYVILFSNGLLNKGQPISLTDVVARAQAAQINLYTVYVGQPGTGDGAGGQSLQKLAGLTHGEFLVLDKPEALTPLLQHLADQRQQYQLGYRSAVTVTGQAVLSATVALPDGSEAASGSVTFPLRVEPPVVTFPNLPADLSLGPPSAGIGISYTVPVAVDFPDGHPRRVQSIELFVDGQVVDTQPASPLNWNLQPYATGGPHTLLARATDELGFIAESAPFTLTLSFTQAPVSAPAAVSPTLAFTAVTPPAAAPAPARWLLVVGVGLLAAALVVGGVWVAARWPQRGAGKPRQSKLDEVAPGDATWPSPTALSSAPTTPAAPPRPASFTLFPKKRAAPAARTLGRAYLEVVEGTGLPRAPIEILVPTLRLGRDGTRAEVVFQDRSVSRLHARITEEAEGHFRIYDEGSTSGTWVNFTQIPAEGGWEIKSGDMINLGRVQLRFKQREEPPTSAARPASKPPQAPPEKRPGSSGETEPYRPAQK